MHVKRRVELDDDFHHPSSSPQRQQWGAVSAPPPQRRIDESQSANAVGDVVLAAHEQQLLDVDHPRVDKFDVAR